MPALGSLRWSFHMAQRSLGDVIRRALVDGPQLIHHDTGDVVVLPLREYERLAGSTGGAERLHRSFGAKGRRLRMTRA